MRYSIGGWTVNGKLTAPEDELIDDEIGDDESVDDDIGHVLRDGKPRINDVGETEIFALWKSNVAVVIAVVHFSCILSANLNFSAPGSFGGFMIEKDDDDDDDDDDDGV